MNRTANGLARLRAAAGTTRWLTRHPLAKRDLAGAMGRWARWQIASRAYGGAFVVPFAGDSVLQVHRGMLGATGNIYAGLQEFEDMAFVLHFLRETDVFMDVGANVGVYTVLASRVCGARTIAVEPSSGTIEHLKANVRINAIGPLVDAIQAALSDVPGRARFTSGLDTVDHVLSEGETASGAVDVPVTTVDALAASRRPALIKIDVEGYETKVLGGASQTLRDPTLGAVIVEANGSGNRYGFRQDDLRVTLEGHGFSRCVYAPFSRELIEIGAFPRRGDNEIYVRDVGRVRGLLARAPKVSVIGFDI